MLFSALFMILSQKVDSQYGTCTHRRPPWPPCHKPLVLHPLRSRLIANIWWAIQKPFHFPEDIKFHLLSYKRADNSQVDGKLWLKKCWRISKIENKDAFLYFFGELIMISSIFKLETRQKYTYADVETACEIPDDSSRGGDSHMAYER